MTGCAIYLSGGTTGEPKLRRYYPDDLAEAVAIKAEFLAHHGLGAGAAVLVLHPFSPWTIGRVHTEAAMALGATVLPLGPRPRSFAPLIRSFTPTVVCGAARVALAHVEELRPSVELLVHAGEPLTPKLRRLCSERLGCRVVNCYGMSEFDLVAGEADKTDILWLRRGLDCAVQIGGAITLASPGCCGELLLRRQGQNGWYRTGDRVEISRKEACPIHAWGSTWSFQFLERLDGRLFFADGSSVGDSDLLALQAVEPAVEEVQFLVGYDEFGPDSIMVRFSGEADPSTVVESLLAGNPDLADAVSLGVVESPAAVRVAPSELLRTARGKVKPVVPFIGDEP